MKFLDADTNVGFRQDTSSPNRPSRSARRLRLGTILLALSMVIAACGESDGGEAVDQITVDWAYYNPVSLVLREKGWLEEEIGS
jgi:sulfonate transport system substrate-binding protein